MTYAAVIVARWNPQQYLRFEADRTRPCRDLVAAIELDSPSRIADLGCGPGNSTEVLAQRYPGASILAVDRSEAMLEAARQRITSLQAEQGDLSSWVPTAPMDLLFSNAALHWVPELERVLPRLFASVRPHGALALQVPHNLDAPGQLAMREVAETAAFRGALHGFTETWYMRAPSIYYELLAPHAQRIDLWVTEYQHVLPNADAIVEWYKGSSLPALLERLPEISMREAFVEAYAERVRASYRPQSDGCVLFPFKRLFCVAYRNGA